MIKKTFIKFLVVSPILLAINSAYAATNLSLYPTKINVKEGQTFKVYISANPNGVKNYTIKSSIKFPSDLVSVKTWSYASDWIPLRKPGYDSFSNTDGTIVRTAGYPEGFDQTSKFGTIVFTAKKTGTAVIEFANDGMALNSDSINVYDSGNKSTVTITNTEVATSTDMNPPAGEMPPEQLFDIRLLVDNASVVKSEQLTYRITFQSFGRVPTPVDLQLSVIDEKGKTVWSGSDKVTVETEKVLTRKLAAANLPAGNYTLKLHTKYNSKVEDDFKAPFQVVSKEQTVAPFDIKPYIIGGFVFLILILLIIKRSKDDKKKKITNHYN